jgi:hypothetical protein
MGSREKWEVNLMAWITNQQYRLYSRRWVGAGADLDDVT